MPRDIVTSVAHLVVELMVQSQSCKLAVTFVYPTHW